MNYTKVINHLKSFYQDPDVVLSIGGLVLIYTLLIFTVYIWMALKAWRTFRPAPYIDPELRYKPKVNIIVPAFNEEVTIIDSINSMLRQDYDNFNVIIVNDGSTDNTLQKVVDEYSMVKQAIRFKSFSKKYEKIYTNEVRGVYQTLDGKISLIDKINGGKSSASNVGCIFGDGEWILAVDADTLLIKNAISETLRKKRHDVDAVSAMIGIVNGNKIVDGDVIDPEVPKGLLARIQWLEYLRSFVLWRTANDEHNCTLVISGAFGLIRREKVLEIGGYKDKFLGEDMELTMNIHNNNGKVQFISEIMAWTEVPETLKSLGKQRVRWYRGGLQSLIEYRNMVFNKKDNKFLGLFMIPFLWFADVAGPWVELTGYFLTGYYLYSGMIIDWELYIALFCVITLFHYVSMSLILIFAYRKLDSNVAPKKWYRIIPVIMFETCTYHFVHYYWMIKSHIQEYVGTKHKWNKFNRKGFNTEK
jgi:cellulose synthase/poly-beta-1,6-N-acetylglucosamine synthase-like glycosyltransferase